MSGAGISTEQGVTTEQHFTPIIATKLSSQEPVFPPHRSVDLEALYQGEVSRRKIKKGLPGQKAWEELKKIAASRENPEYYQEEQQSRPRSITDKVHRQTLLIQARLEGIKDLDRFQELADYFESTVYDRETRTIALSKGLSDEQKNKVIENWRAKGWSGRTDDIWESPNQKYDSLHLTRTVPFRFGREHVKLIKNIVSTDDNPLELIKSMKQIGFAFHPYTLESPDRMKKLGEFLTAPHVKEVLKLAKEISCWDSTWFVNDGDYFDRPIEVGNIEFLTQIARSSDPGAIFPLELVQKINILSTIFNMKVGAADINTLQTIIANPDYLDFTAYLSRFIISKSSYFLQTATSVFENIVTLDQAGLLKPIVQLYRSGVSFDNELDFYHPNRPSLKKLFDSFEAKYQPQEVRQEVVQHLQDTLAQVEIQSLLTDEPRREFVGLLAELRGCPTTVEELSKLDELFGVDITKKSEAIFVLKFLQGFDKDDQLYVPDLDTLSIIASSPVLIETYKDKEFSEFVKTLKAKTGYKPYIYDFYSPEYFNLVDVFNDPKIRRSLVKDTTVEVIKALDTGSGMQLFQSEYYVRLANNPNMVSTIKALKNTGLMSPEFYRPDYAELLESVANYPNAASKLISPDMQDLLTRLTHEFKWTANSREITDLLALYDDKNLRQQLFDPNNIDFIKKMHPDRFYLSHIKLVLDLDPVRRDLLMKLVDQFEFLPDFSSWGIQVQQEILDKFIQNDELRIQFFSEKTQKFVKELQQKIGYFYLHAEDLETIVKAPNDLSDFITELEEKYGCIFGQDEWIRLIEFAADRKGFNNLLDTLSLYGYSFHASDYSNLLLLMPFSDKLPDLVSMLSDVMGYQFHIQDSVSLELLIKNGYTKERLIALKQIYTKYNDDNRREFYLHSIQNALFIEANQDTITRLENYNYTFCLSDLPYLKDLLDLPDKDRIFQILDILRDNLSFNYTPSLIYEYIKLARLPGIEEKIKQAGVSIPKSDLIDTNNFELFVALGADAELYNHARKLLSDYFFRYIRDAQNRISQFNNQIRGGYFPDDVITKIFTVSGKATELDRIALRYMINAEIAKASNNPEWYTPLLQATNFQEADEILMETMTDLAIPVIYSDLKEGQLNAKKDELIALANKNKEFDDVLEIACRSVGIYGQSHPKRDRDFGILMGAIRLSLELNIERNPEVYLHKRAKLSGNQFDRIFQEVSDNVKEQVMKTWLDLSPRRRLRVNGDIIATEESTLSRLNVIKDMVRTDLSVHIQELFAAKLRELEATIKRTGTNSPVAEQLAIYKQYLITPEGLIRQDILTTYRSVEAFIRKTQTALKNSETPKEEKGKLAKSLGTYQAISNILKALYRLGTISEQRYKTRRDYLKEIEKHIGELSGALKRLKILDSEKRSTDTNIRALEEEVLLDFYKLKDTMAEENVSGQIMFETESTVDFRNLARAPEITQSCQRLTEATGYNHAAYSRLLDGSNEMIDIYMIKNGERIRLARSFIELSKVRLNGENQNRLVVLLDREYVNPQYQGFGHQFSSEMMLHMLDRLSSIPELSLIFSGHWFTATPEVQKILLARGYQLRSVSGEYFVNESTVRLSKYYDSLYGLTNVASYSWMPFDNFYIIEKT